MRRVGSALCAALVVVMACSEGGDGTGESAAGGGDDTGGDDAAADAAGDGATGGDKDEDVVINFCELITSEDIGEEFGDVGPIGDGRHDFNESDCAWDVNEVIDDPAGDGGTVKIQHDNSIETAISGSDEDTAQRTFDDIRAGESDSDLWDAPPVDVEGIGDAAYYVASSRDTGVGQQSHAVLMVLDGDVVFSVSAVFIPAIDDNQSRLEGVAGVVAELV